MKSVFSWFVSKEVWKNSLVKQKMRDLARLLLQRRKTDSNLVSQLYDLIKPARFDDVVNAVKNIAKFHFYQGVQNVGTPSLSLLGMTGMTRND